MENCIILYGCMYCKRLFLYNKKRLVDHLKKGCRKKKGACKHTLLCEATPQRCYVYFNETNCHLNVKEDLLPLITFPEVNQYFVTSNDWKTVRLIEDTNVSSDDEEAEEKS